jgi:predicted nicotinamide N-methyase
MSELSSDIIRDSITTLHGDALDAALARRFVLADEEVTLGAVSFTLRKPANADHLISEADYVMDERLPYWADLWPSSRQLATTLLSERGAGRTLLELGCGLGLPTLAAMRAGFDVTATDYYEDALQVTRANAGRNLGREPQVRMVNWRSWPDDLGQFDVIVAADVIYEQEYAVLVAACIARALAPDGVAIVADPGRVALARFHAELPTVGLEMFATTTTPYVDGKINQQIQVMRLRHVTAAA